MSDDPTLYIATKEWRAEAKAAMAAKKISAADLARVLARHGHGSFESCKTQLSRVLSGKQQVSRFIGPIGDALGIHPPNLRLRHGRLQRIVELGGDLTDADLLHVEAVMEAMAEKRRRERRVRTDADPATEDKNPARGSQGGRGGSSGGRDR